MYSLTKALSRPASSPTEAIRVPRTFLGFCEWLGVTLTPGQAELGRVSFDGMEPLDRGLAERLFGPDVPLGIRRVVAAVCGARAGKSYVLIALRLVWGMLVRDVSAVPPGQRAVALIIAPRDDLRMEVFRYAIGAVQSKPELAALLATPPKVDEFTLRRPDGRLVSFETGVATMGGTAARGRWLTDCGMDECSFFRDSSYKVNDQEIFRAATPRILPGGQLIVASTPWAQSGLLYELWKDRASNTTNTIVAHAPTLLLHDSPLTRDIVQMEMDRDPENARREYGAEFMATGTTVFFDGASIDTALDDSEFTVQPADQIVAGGDFGFRADSSALLMAALRGQEIHVFDGVELRPDDGLPLKPSETVASFAECINNRCPYLMADQHYREAISEQLEQHGLNYAPAPLTPADTYVRARMLLRDLRIKIHPLPFRDRLVQQMREVQGKPTSGGGMSIVHPRWSKGGHGDLCAAFVLAVWQLAGEAVRAPDPVPLSREWEAELVERRRKKFKEQQERSEWLPKAAANDRGSNAWWKK